MTEAEFKTKALEIGLSEKQIACQIELQEKLKREGLPGVSYEDILRAKTQNSCMNIFEEHIGA
ncbi:MAG: hypothetical protein J6M62_07095 [Selenomonadaceae bacterium]|nr:hypothetical protein [Selenomonadaceae bacterium]MBP3723001.1 hypothetical protein [Selenomonadaceae bacterium]